MQVRKVIPMYNGDMERLKRLGKFSKSEEAQFRLRVIEFSQKWGIRATEDTFIVIKDKHI